ncbi:proteasome endopeptidase complex beta subunit [Phaffia rhodozyma]|uniref:Proteasome subunit beta n=1 Tax=Phaffia rhodozyma TaxID=264483 RepID=A0A0F7SEQ3_PHARH|nr:proteasome endopeptidase complex beta subunit [Phaffia rhodozyma]
MDHFPLSWGRPRNENSQDMFNAAPMYKPQDWEAKAFGLDGGSHGQMDEISHTQQPIVTGTSVLALKYKDGIMLAADTLASYGSLARFKDIERLKPIGDYTVIGAGGDMSDFQFLEKTLEGLVIEEANTSDGHNLGPKEVYSYLSKYMYARRTKMNPLWNSLLVGGVKNGERFLGYVDLIGTTYTASTLATGYGSYIAQPLLRKAVEGNEDTLTREQAEQVMIECMKVLYYRDARSLNKFQIATVTSAGVEISETMSAKTEWAFAEKLRGYGAQTQ